MQPAVRRKEAESDPALVDVGRGRALEAADVVAPEAEPAKPERQPAPQRLGHRLVARARVAAPVHGESLRAHRGRAREERGLPLAQLLVQHLEDATVVEERVVVVHLHGVRAVRVDDVGRDTLAEVGLEAVDAHVDQGAQLVAEPAVGVRIREVNQAHAGLPLVPLPHVAVGAFEEVAPGAAFLEERRPLPDVGVDPDADAQAALLQPLQHAGWVGENVRVPLEVAPVEPLHPEAVEVEDVQRQVAVGHALDEARHRSFVVVGREGRREPQPEGPGRRHGGATRQRRVLLQHFLRRRTVDDEVLKRLAGHAEPDTRDLLRADLERDALRMVHQHPVAAIAQVEGHVLVGELGRRAAVRVPHLDRLPVLDEGREAFPQAVDALADAQAKLLLYVRRALRLGFKPIERVLRAFAHRHPAHVAEAGVRERLAGAEELDPPRPAPDSGGQLAAAEGQLRLGFGDLRIGRRLMDLEGRPALHAARVVREPDPDDVRCGRGQADRQHRAVQRRPAFGRRLGRGMDDQLALAALDLVHAGGIMALHARPEPPEPAAELHDPPTSRIPPNALCWTRRAPTGTAYAFFLGSQ